MTSIPIVRGLALSASMIVAPALLTVSAFASSPTNFLATPATPATPNAPTVYVGEQGEYHWAKIEVTDAGEYTLIERRTFAGKVQDGKELSVASRPLTIVEHQAKTKDRELEVSAQTAELLDSYLIERGLPLEPEPIVNLRKDEVVTLLDNGPSENRIDITFLGDGYTADQRELFFADVKRLVQETFYDVTFVSYLPVINIHAVWRPSNEQGIGINETPKDTAYKLYRPGNTMRAVFVGDRNAGKDSCSQAPGCDYGIIVGNDPYYGGVASSFATTTSSATSGAVVLRHELGHTMGSVGEEYDGGAYFGRNSSRKPDKLSWIHFVTNKDKLRVEPQKLRHLSWPWKNLKNRPSKLRFTSEAGYTIGNIYFSASGLKAKNSAKLTLDGKELKFDNPGVDDRTFRNIDIPEGFGPGQHEIVFSENDADGNNYLSSILVTEYKADYNFDDNYYGAYPNHSQSGSVQSYRPTHNACLMRKMYSKNFCKACQENNWLQMLNKISLIDSLTAKAEGKKVTLTVATQAIGQFRKDGLKDPGTFTVTWKKGGVEQPQLADKFTPVLDACSANGDWEAVVEYVTPEILHAKKAYYTVDEAKVTVAKQPGC